MKGLTPTVLRLGLVSLLGDIASEMLYPITPVFLTSVLGAPMLYVGLIEGVAEAVSSFLKIYAGKFSDKIRRRKPFIFWGYLLSAFSRPVIGLAQSWTHVLIARVSDRFGKGIRTSPRDALLADSVGAEERGAAFGWHRGFDTVGAALGPLLALAFLSLWHNDLRRVYFFALIPGLLSAFLVLTIKDKTVSAHSAKEVPSGRMSDVWKAPGVKKYLTAWGIFSITSFSDTFLIIKTKQTTNSITQTILIYCTYNIFYALLSPYLGHLSDKWGRRKLLSYGLLLFALVYAGFGFATKEIHFWILFIFYGIYMAATEGNSKAKMVDLTPGHLTATGIGLFNSVVGILSLAAGVICGFLWDHFGSLTCFLYGAVGALVTAVIIFYEPVEN